MAGSKKIIAAAIGAVVVLAMVAPLGYQHLSKTSLEDQAPPLIESWLLKAFPDEFEPGMVKGVQAPRTFASQVHLPATVMAKSGSLRQVCVTFQRDGFLGDWYAVGECVPAADD